jgi:hypothetical protein
VVVIGEKRSGCRRTGATTALSNTNPTLSGLGPNASLRVAKPAPDNRMAE